MRLHCGPMHIDVLLVACMAMQPRSSLGNGELLPRGQWHTQPEVEAGFDTSPAPAPPIVLNGMTLLHLLPAKGRGPPLRPGENATYADGKALSLGRLPSAQDCEQRTVVGEGRFYAFTYFSEDSAAGLEWAKFCYGRTDRAFTPFPEAGVVSGRRGTACTTSADCEENGSCDSTGRCVCDSGWKGDSCGELDLLPAAPMGVNGYNRLHAKPGFSSWGGSIIQDDQTGVFHMFAAEIDKGCGINLWYPNSRCIRATSKTMDGPYQFAEVVKPSFCHEPVVVREPGPDGKYLVFHVGRTTCPECGAIHTCEFGNGTTDCEGAGVFNNSHGNGHARCYPNGGGYNHSYHDGLGVMSAPSLEGPWSSTYLSGDAALFDTNPAPFIFPNGTAIMLTRQKDPDTGGGQMRIRVGRAPDWRGPWNYSVALVETGSEDPHLFFNPTRGGSFHAIFHHNNYKSWPLAQGTHAYSKNGLDWTYSSVTAYSGIIEDEGGGQTVWNRRERPHILTAPNGSLLALTTGVGNAVDGWIIGQDYTWTHVQPIRVQSPSLSTPPPKLHNLTTSPFTVDARGYFRRQLPGSESELFIPVGVNYWPLSSGARLWFQPEFPEAEIERDFETLRQTGFNAVRIFLTWPCFEPRPGEFNTTQFDNLLLMLAMARHAELAVDISVFVGGMSGAFYWPDWVTGNIYTDPTTIAQTRTFALHVARTVAPYADCIFALEIGNEMNNVETGQHCQAPQVADPRLTVQQIVAWTQTIVDALHEGLPGSVVVPGTGDGAIHADSGWTLGDQAHQRVAGDTLNFHPYAVLFDPTHGDGLLDPLTHAVSGYAAAFVRAHGPAFMQEWGTLLTSGQMQQDGYLRAVLPEAFAQGANGFLWWCMRDFLNVADEPYNTHGKESLLGLYVGDTSTVKPGLEYLVQFAKNVSSMTVPPALPEDKNDSIGLYLPAHHYAKQDPMNPGNSPATTVLSANLAYHFVRMLGGSTRVSRVIRGDLPLPSNLKTLIIPSVLLTAPEIERLSTWVGEGGRLIWHGFNQDACETAAGSQLVGVVCHQDGSVGGLPSRGNLNISFGGAEWRLPLGWPATESNRSHTRSASMHANESSAKRIWSAALSDGTSVSAAALNQHGAGVVLAVALPVEYAIDPLGVREERDRWAKWYATAVDCVETASCDGAASKIGLSSDGKDTVGSHVVSRVAPDVRRQQHSTKRIGIYSCTHSVEELQQTRAQLEGKGVCTAADATPAAKAGSAVWQSQGAPAAANLTSPLLDSVLEQLDIIVVPSQRYVTLVDQRVIAAFVNQGGCVIRHGIDTSTFAADAWDTIGAAATDFRSPLPSTFSAFGRRWTMSSYLGAGSVHVELGTSKPLRPSWGRAKQLAVDGRGIGALFFNRLVGSGGGTAVTATAAVDNSLSGHDLKDWYGHVLQLCSN